ncbi:hypothetical protein SDC9_77378 [bioreactor metagenome]|uniref:Lipoprotein n=1 Tax=bioreactor metagenome TaxID=1076179 RepID=A0A644YS71_9ZZZZ
MKKILILLLVAALAASCTSSHKYLERQQFDMAIQKSAKKLMKNPDKDKQIDVLSRAWKAANTRDMERITYLKTTGQPEIWDEIFQIYSRMKWRQDIVRNLPQPVLSAIGYAYVDYTNETVNAQRNAAEFYYQKAMALMETGDRFSARQAYDHLLQTKRFFATYKDVDQQILRAQAMGTANVLFISRNNSGQIIPDGFLDEILKFSLGDIEGRFVKFYSSFDTSRQYHYKAVLNLTKVDVSPESVRELFYEESKEVQDGWTYVLDSHGNVMKDSLGNDIKIPKMVDITCRIHETQLHKQAIVGGYLDIYAADNTLLRSDPITAETFFDYAFATADGDKSILKDETKRKLANPPSGFPDSFKMIWDASSIVKNIAKDILVRNAYIFQ